MAENSIDIQYKEKSHSVSQSVNSWSITTRRADQLIDRWIHRSTQISSGNNIESQLVKRRRHRRSNERTNEANSQR